MFSPCGRWFPSECLFFFSLSLEVKEKFSITFSFFLVSFLSFFLFSQSIITFSYLSYRRLTNLSQLFFYCLFKYIHLLHLLITLYTSTKYKNLIPCLTAECGWNNESNNHWYPACSKFRFFFFICKLDVIRFLAAVEVLRVPHIPAD